MQRRNRTHQVNGWMMQRTDMKTGRLLKDKRGAILLQILERLKHCITHKLEKLLFYRFKICLRFCYVKLKRTSYSDCIKIVIHSRGRISDLILFYICFFFYFIAKSLVFHTHIHITTKPHEEKKKRKKKPP